MQLRNIFGSTRHGPRSLFKKTSKAHNNGRDVNLLRPADTRMATEHLQFMRVLRLKDPLMAASRDPVFIDYGRFEFVGNIIGYPSFWTLLFAMVQALHPVYRLLRLADLKCGGMDRVKYYVLQTDRLLMPGLENVVTQWENPLMPNLELSSASLSKSDKEFLKGKRFVWLLITTFILTLC